MVNLNLYSWATNGRQKRAILKAMSDTLTPTQICKISKEYNRKISLNNASDIVRSFAKKGLAICLNKEQRTGRLYKLTNEGEEIRTEFMKYSDMDY